MNAQTATSSPVDLGVVVQPPGDRRREHAGDPGKVRRSASSGSCARLDVLRRLLAQRREHRPRRDEHGEHAQPPLARWSRVSPASASTAIGARLARGRGRARLDAAETVRDSGGIVTCQACGTTNEPGRKFCGECGSALALACPSCGRREPAGRRSSAASAGRRSDGAARRRPAAARRRPPAERRLVSVLFADLVGFTTAVGGARRRGRARAPLALLRHLPAADRAATAARSRSSSATR